MSSESPQERPNPYSIEDKGSQVATPNSSLHKKQLDALVHLAQDVGRVANYSDLKNLSTFLLNQSLKLMGGERGVLALLKDGKLLPSATFELKDDGVDTLEGLSQDLLEQVVRTRQATLIESDAPPKGFVFKFHPVGHGCSNSQRRKDFRSFLSR